MAVGGKQGSTRGKGIPNPQAMAVKVNGQTNGQRKSQGTLRFRKNETKLLKKAMKLPNEGYIPKQSHK